MSGGETPIQPTAWIPTVAPALCASLMSRFPPRKFGKPRMNQLERFAIACSSSSVPTGPASHAPSPSPADAAADHRKGNCSNVFSNLLDAKAFYAESKQDPFGPNG